MRQAITSILLLFATYCFGGNGIPEQQIESIVTELEHIAQSQGARADSLVHELCRIAEGVPDNNDLTNLCLYWEAAVNYAQGISNPGLTTALKERIASRSPLPKRDDALLSYALAMSYIISGDYGDAFTTALHSLSLYRELNDTRFIVKNLMALGTICVAIRNYKMGEEYFQEATRLTVPTQREYYQAYINMYRLYFFAKRSSDAIDSAVNFIPELKQYQDTGMLAVAYFNLGASYSVNGQYDIAYLYYDTVSQLANRIDNKALRSGLSQNLGIYYYQNDSLDKAHLYFKEHQRAAEQNKNYTQQAGAWNNLALNFFKRGLYDSAYLYLFKYHEMSSRLINNAKAIDAYQAYISVLLESSENKLIIAEQEIKLRSRWLLSTIAIAVAIVAVAILLLVLVRHQQKRKEKENRELEERLKQEEEMMELQKNALDAQQKALEAQEREIASSSLLLSSKNNILQQILKLADSLKTDQKELREIKGIVKSNLSSDSDWKNFLLHFEKVHPDFFNNLKARSNELTTSDLKLCAYMRIGMDSKQIAQILNISYGSVRIHRYRIKKKLNLAEEENLDDFLRNV